MEVKPSQIVSGVFSTASPTTGMGADPTGLGSATTGRVYVNGVYASGATVTLEDEGTTDGVTKWTFTVPGTAVEGNHIQCLIFATVGGITANTCVFDAMVVTRLPGELATAATLGDVATALGAVTTTTQDISTKVGATGVVVAAASKTGYALPSAYDLAKTAAQAADILGVLTHQMIESYAAKGTAPTLAQALFMVLRLAEEKTIVGTTMQVKDSGGNIVATYSLSIDPAPQAYNTITRAS